MWRGKQEVSTIKALVELDSNAKLNDGMLYHIIGIKSCFKNLITVQHRRPNDNISF